MENAKASLIIELAFMSLSILKWLLLLSVIAPPRDA